jgi:hypothetical protein
VFLIHRMGSKLNIYVHFGTIDILLRENRNFCIVKHETGFKVKGNLLLHRIFTGVNVVKIQCLVIFTKRD